MSDPGVVPEPEGTANLDRDDAVFETCLITARPDSGFVQRELVVDASVGSAACSVTSPLGKLSQQLPLNQAFGLLP